MKTVIQAIDRHFKKHLGNDYFTFYLDWFLLLAIPTALYALLPIAIHWMKGGVS